MLAIELKVTLNTCPYLRLKIRIFSQEDNYSEICTISENLGIRSQMILRNWKQFIGYPSSLLNFSYRKCLKKSGGGGPQCSEEILYFSKTILFWKLLCCFFDEHWTPLTWFFFSQAEILGGILPQILRYGFFLCFWPRFPVRKFPNMTRKKSRNRQTDHLSLFSLGSWELSNEQKSLTKFCAPSRSFRVSSS